MAREIKFRAWDKKEKEWIGNGDSMDLYHSASANCFLFDNDNYDLHSEIEFVQFTGLNDKNGKEIYEGDLLKDTSGYVRKVGFKTGMFGKGLDYHFYQISEADEVIGNIYENPDLLST